MSESVKRYWLESYVDGFYKARQFVLASDHDRIVSALIAGREAAERENESLRSKARASEQAALELRAEVERLQRELGTAHADASHYASTAEDLRAEGERLRKDAERYRWARRPESGNALFTLTGSGECGPNMDSAIDAAMEASL